MLHVNGRDNSPAEWRRAGLPPSPVPSGKPCFIRYSVPPRSGSRNYDAGFSEGGVSVFRAYARRDLLGSTVTIDLQESLPLAICFIRMSSCRKPFFAGGEVVGAGSGREPLLDPDTLALRPVPPSARIEPNVPLPEWLTGRVLEILEHQRLAERRKRVF